MRFDLYYVSDSGEMTCATCALADTVTQLERAHKEAGDPAGRLLALVKMTAPDDIDDLFDAADDYLRGYSARYGINGRRNAAAVDLLRDTVSGWNDNGEASNWGENCGGCGKELVEEYVVCGWCDASDYASSFDFAAGADHDESDHRHDGPVVTYCGRCEDTYVPGDAEVIGEDSRGYVLTFRSQYRGAMTYGPAATEPTAIYAAGCRRLTLADALRHWNRSDRGARELTAMVLGHAMRRALPGIVIPGEE